LAMKRVYETLISWTCKIVNKSNLRNFEVWPKLFASPPSRTPVILYRTKREWKLIFQYLVLDEYNKYIYISICTHVGYKVDQRKSPHGWRAYSLQYGRARLYVSILMVRHPWSRNNTTAVRLNRTRSITLYASDLPRHCLFRLAREPSRCVPTPKPKVLCIQNVFNKDFRDLFVLC
jgi:hypothetical protein